MDGIVIIIKNKINCFASLSYTIDNSTIIIILIILLTYEYQINFFLKTLITVKKSKISINKPIIDGGISRTNKPSQP